MAEFISLTTKDVVELLKGKNVEVTIDGKPRVYVKHCDCEICEDYSDKFHDTSPWHACLEVKEE
jgi:hypothetical protein